VNLGSGALNGDGANPRCRISLTAGETLVESCDSGPRHGGRPLRIWPHREPCPNVASRRDAVVDERQTEHEVPARTFPTRARGIRDLISAFAAIAAASFLASCGGGDGDNGASTLTYQLHAAWVNYVTDSGTKAFTLTGMSPAIAIGADFTGSGTATFGQLDSATFESQPVLKKAITATGLIYATGHTVHSAI
jgi:hypothetical protein